MSFYINFAKKSLIALVSTLTITNFFTTELKAAESIVIGKASQDATENPITIFLGVANHPILNKEVAKMLSFSNWFDLKKANSKVIGEYYIKGQVAGSILQLGVYDSNKQLKYTVNQIINANNLNITAAKAVDKVLTKIFKVKGLCSTKIAFAVQAKVGVKNIYTANFDSSGSVALTKNNNLCVEPSWTPLNRSLVYTRYNRASTDIVEYNLEANRSRRLVQLPGLNSGGKVSPDGKYLAMVLSKGKTIDLYIRALNGSNPVKITNDKAVEAALTWSPNSKQICYISDKSGRPNLYVMLRNGSGVTRINAIGNEQASPNWSGDNKIAYAAKMGREYAIAVYDFKTGKNTLITNSKGNWEEPSWAPDNRHIVCSRKIGGGRSALYIIDTKTKKARQFMSGKYSLSYPVWSHVIK